MLRFIIYYKYVEYINNIKEMIKSGVKMKNTIFEQVGKNIQNVLNEQGKTQQFLAEQLGISKQVMSKIITGTKAINVVEISKIADVLNVSTDYLLSVQTTQESNHNFSFMGKVKNEETKKKIEFLKTIIDEILILEEYAGEE